MGDGTSAATEALEQGARPDAEGTQEPDWTLVANELGMDPDDANDPAKIAARLEERERERNAGVERRLQELRHEQEKFERAREEVAELRGQLTAYQQQQEQRQSDDPTEFYELIGAEDPDEPLTARQLWRGQSFLLDWIGNVETLLEDQPKQFKETVEPLRNQVAAHQGVLGATLLAQEVNDVLSEVPEDAPVDREDLEEDLLDVIATHKDASTLHEALRKRRDRMLSATTKRLDDRLKQQAREAEEQRRPDRRRVTRGARVAAQDGYRTESGELDLDKFAADTFPGGVEEPI